MSPLIHIYKTIHMQNNIRCLLSFFTLVLFVILAAASFGPDSASNTIVKVGNCEPKPPINVSAKVNVLVIDNEGNPVQAGEGSLFINNLIVVFDSCEYDPRAFYKEHVVIGPDGTYHFQSPPNLHENSQDLYRVELVFRIAGRESRTVKTLKYDQTTVSFTLKTPDPDYP